jgi:enoyl-CoA hydratase
MTLEVLDTLETFVDSFEKSTARAAVLTGYEKFFSAGLPLPMLIDLDRAAMKVFIERFSRAMLRVFTCEKPIVAAINGHAIAGGCVLALMCDERVMVDTAEMRIGLNETQLGIGLPAIVLEPLRAQVPPSSFARIAYRGELLTPHEAEILGLVHHVVDEQKLLITANLMVEQLAAVGTLAVQQVKRGLRSSVVDAIVRTDAVETERWLDTWFSDEAQQRLRAAVAKMTKR